MTLLSNMTTRITFLKHQLDAQPILQRMDTNGNGGILADSMGMGKTYTMSLYMVSNKFRSKCDLIICPYSLVNVWSDCLYNIHKQVHGVKPNILIYHGPRRKKSIRSSMIFDYVISTYGILTRSELSYKSWGRVVLDESHTIKNGSRRTRPPKCAMEAFKVGKKSMSNWCISGTPFNNRHSDIISHAMFIGTEPYDNREWWKDNISNTEALQKWQSDFVLRRTKDDILSEPIYIDKKIIPTTREQKLVDILRKQASEEFKRWEQARRNRDNRELMKIQGKILALIQKLRMISNSFYSSKDFNDDERIVKDIIKYNRKVSEILDDVQDNIETNKKKGIVIFSQFTSFLKILKLVFSEKIPNIDIYMFNGSMNIKERNKVVDEFNVSNKPRVILVSLMAGGTGLSLHHGSSTVIISEPYYNPFIEQQAEERVHRIGQTEQVKVIRYVTENSIETWMQSMKDKKTCIAGEFNLVKGNKIPVNFDMNDVVLLFKKHVNFYRSK